MPIIAGAIILLIDDIMLLIWSSVDSSALSGTIGEPLSEVANSLNKGL